MHTSVYPPPKTAAVDGSSMCCGGGKKAVRDTPLLLAFVFFLGRSSWKQLHICEIACASEPVQPNLLNVFTSNAVHSDVPDKGSQQLI